MPVPPGSTTSQEIGRHSTGSRSHEVSPHRQLPQSAAPARSSFMKLWTDALGRAAVRGVQLLVLIAVAAVVFYVLLAVKVVVLAVLVALILASAVRPLVSALERHGWHSAPAAAVVFLSLLLLLGGVVTGVVLGIRGSLPDLTTAAASGWRQLQDLVHGGPLPVPLDANTVNDALSQVGDYLKSATARDSAITGLSVAAEVLTGTVLMVIVLFFFLKDGPRLWAFVLRWFRGSTRARLAESGDRAVGILGGYVRGISLIATVDAVLIGIGLLVVGVPLVIPLTVVMFLSAYVPIVGAITAGAMAALVALVAKGPLAALIVVGVVFVVHHVEGYFLHPVVMGHTLSLHGLVVLLVLAAGSILGGVAGAVLAVPLTAVGWGVLQVWTDRYQSGDDPVLGPDPVHRGKGVAERVSRAQRWKYQLMRRQARSPRAVAPAEHDDAPGA